MLIATVAAAVVALTALTAQALAAGAPQNGEPTFTLAPAANHLQLSIQGPGEVTFARPTLNYRLICTASCRGTLRLQVWLVPRRQAPHGEPQLGFGPQAISIGALNGGSATIAYSYRGRALDTLKHALADGDAVEFRVTAAVHNGSGQQASAAATTRLNPAHAHVG